MTLCEFASRYEQNFTDKMKNTAMLFCYEVDDWKRLEDSKESRGNRTNLLNIGLSSLHCPIEGKMP